MDLQLPINIASNYSSSSQRIRVITEYWVSKKIYCPNCGTYLNSFANNKPVADFWCDNCTEEYELKAKKGALGKKIVNGAYSTMIERLQGNNHPHLFLLTYNPIISEVQTFFTIPNYFFTPDIIEKRQPLTNHARRAGWVGCNIIMNNIPEMGKIYYVKNREVISKQEVLAGWRKTDFVNTTRDIEAKGWLLDILVCVEKLNKQKFTLEEVYKYEDWLSIKHPSNNNIRAKIRQQLQLLRDRNVIEFLGRGTYAKM